MSPPTFDEHLGFEECIELFPCKKFVSKLAAEAFTPLQKTRAILPRTAGLDEERLHANFISISASWG